MAILFSFPDSKGLALKINEHVQLPLGDVTVRHFPDGESFVQIKTDIKNQDVVVICGLDNPDQKAMPLMFFAQLAKELGAKRLQLIAPYLGYMRQDKRFNPGEAVTSTIFARFLSQHVDSLITIDPHLHRRASLDEIYTIPTHVIHASDAIASWIQQNIKNPVLIGPDSESKQWVSGIADAIDAPYIVLTKIRRGDKDVDILFPKIENFKNHTPVLVDDIISTGMSMISVVHHLHKIEMSPPVCIGIHALFAGDAYKQLQQAGTRDIVTCNTVTHESNKIDISSLLAEAIKR